MRERTIGDYLSWKSIHEGWKRIKTGYIVAIVEPNESLHDAVKRIKEWSRHYSMRGIRTALDCDTRRSDRSYLVAVKVFDNTQAKLRVYWPQNKRIVER